MAGTTLDTGALNSFERAARRTMVQLKLAQQFGYELTIPTPVIVEAWRGGKRSARIAALLEACVIEPLLPDLARVAGEAIAAVKGASVVDAVVMASAARRGDRVLTADFAELDRLRSYFPEVRLLQVQRAHLRRDRAETASIRHSKSQPSSALSAWRALVKEFRTAAIEVSSAFTSTERSFGANCDGVD